MCGIAAAVCGDSPADRRAGRHGGTLHPASRRGAEGGAAGRQDRGRLGAGQQDGEGVAGHPQGHRLHSLLVHSLRRGHSRPRAELLKDLKDEKRLSGLLKGTLIAVLLGTYLETCVLVWVCV